MTDGWSLDPEAWREFDEMAQTYGWETGIDLVADILTHPEDYENSGDPRIKGMYDSIQGWDEYLSNLAVITGVSTEQMKDITGYGILIMSGGVNNIFIKSLMGRPEDIDKGDVLTAILEIGGAYGFGEAAKLLGKLPVVGGALTKVGGGLDDLLKSVMKFGVTDDAAKAVDDALKAGLKETIEETGEAGAKESGWLADFLTKGKAGAKAAGEAAETGAKLSDDVIEEIINVMPATSYDDWLKWAKKVGASDDLQKAMKSAYEAYLKNWGDPAKAMELALQDVIKKTPGAGITPQFLKNLSLSHPTLKKVLTYGLGGAVGGGAIGTGLLGYELIKNAAFAGFMAEEMEQLAQFTQFYTADDVQALARSIANVALPVWDMGQNWADNIGEPISGLVGKLPGQYGEFASGITTRPALNYHYTYTASLIDKLTNLQEKGAWTGLEYEGDTSDLTSIKIISWGRNTDQGEIAEFLRINPMYYQYYEKEMDKLAREDPALLYQLYYEGMAEWYKDIPLWMQKQITEYEQKLKDWQYQASRGQLTGQDALDMAEAIAGTIWYDQKDKNILQDAINAGNLVYTMMQKGEISEAKGNSFLLSLSAKLMNNNHSKGLLSLDNTGKVQWKVLSDTELANEYGSLTTIAEKPQLVFTPPGTTMRSEALTPMYTGMTNTDTELTNIARDVARDEGFDLGVPATTLRGEVAEKAKQQYQEFAKTAAGTPGMRGVGVTGPATEEEKAAMAKVPGKPGPAIEGLSNTESRWINAINQGTSDWETLKRLNPETYDSLVQKGYDPTKKPEIKRPVTKTTEKTSPDQKDLVNTINVMKQLGMTDSQISEAVGESVESLGAEGYFKYPEGGYTPELLEAMLSSPNPQERSTAKQMLDQLKKKTAEKKQGGAYGYTGTEVITPKPTEEQTLKELSKIQSATPDLTESALLEIYDYLKTEGTSPTKAISADLSDEAKKAVFGSLGITEYKPTREGYGTTYGVGRRTTGR